MINLNRLASTHALWTAPLPNEKDMPEARIIHARLLSGIGRIRMSRIGVRIGAGFFKCGSLGLDGADWPTAARVLAWRSGEWQVDCDDTQIGPPPVAWRRSVLRDAVDVEPRWLKLNSTEPATAYLVEIRRCQVDGGWVPYPLVDSCVVFEGDADFLNPPQARGMSTNGVAKVEAEPSDHVEHRFERFSIGFSRHRPAISALKLRCIPNARTAKNLLLEDCRAYRIRRSQGVNLVTLNGETLSSDYVRQLTTSARFHENGVEYLLKSESQGIQIRLDYQVSESGIRLLAEIHAAKEIVFSDASICTLILDTLQAIPGVLAVNKTTGSAGTVQLPFLVHFPGYGALRVSAECRSSVVARFDANRNHSASVLDFIPGVEIIEPLGLRMKAGEHQAVVEWRICDEPLPALTHLPAADLQIATDLARSAIAYRADTSTLSNNGISTHCAYALDGMAEVCALTGDILPGLNAITFVVRSLERIFDGGPAYGFGNHPFEPHRIENEYVQSLPSVLSCIAVCLSASGDRWLEKHRAAIESWLDRTDQADLDGDGLIESPHRVGISGGHQWSTNWWDVISFGWKDAFVNAELYGALRSVSKALRSMDSGSAISKRCMQRAAQIEKTFMGTFWNEASRRVAGWQSRDGELHDHAFLFVNGAAVNAGLLKPTTARQVIGDLYAQLLLVGLPHFGWGIPGNLQAVPPDNYALPEIQPFPTYENGGLTWSNSYHFLRALLEVGMTTEFDRITSDMLRYAKVGNPFDGCNSGVDWRRWDGSPCGYEGLLCDQFRWVWLLAARSSPELLR